MNNVLVLIRFDLFSTFRHPSLLKYLCTDLTLDLKLRLALSWGPVSSLFRYTARSISISSCWVTLVWRMARLTDGKSSRLIVSFHLLIRSLTLREDINISSIAAKFVNFWNLFFYFPSHAYNRDLKFSFVFRYLISFFKWNIF